MSLKSVFRTFPDKRRINFTLFNITKKANITLQAFYPMKNQTKCTQRGNIICPMMYSPVCVVFNSTMKCSDKVCTRTLSNECAASAYSCVAKILPGTCKQNGLNESVLNNIIRFTTHRVPKHSKDENLLERAYNIDMPLQCPARNKMCPMYYQPVCVVFDSNVKCNEPICKKTVSNACVASTHSCIKEVLPGAC